MVKTDAELHLGLEMPITWSKIKRICQDRGESQEPPQAFLVSTSCTQNSLLAVRTDFLDRGEGLPWPGLPLLGATFDLDWGYAYVDVQIRADGATVFEQPFGRFEDSETGDIYGYRFCPVDDSGLPQTIRELGRIRKELTRREPRPKGLSCDGITVTDL